MKGLGKLHTLASELSGLPSALERAEPKIADRVSAIESGRKRGGGGRTPGTLPTPWTDAAEDEVSKAVAEALKGSK